MSEMIERVCRAVWPLSAYGKTGMRPDEIVGTEPAWKMYEAFARAAIGAMRDPTEAMDESGYSAACRHDYGSGIPSVSVASAYGLNMSSAGSCMVIERSGMNIGRHPDDHRGTDHQAASERARGRGGRIAA